MANKKQGVPGEGRTARGSGGRGAAHNATPARKPTPEGTGNALRDATQEAPAAPNGAAKRPPPGLDEARHAAAQRAAHQAEVLREAYVPSALATALGMGSQFDGSACRVYLDRFIQDAGNPSDPVERALVEQVAIARLRLADLHSQAAQAKAVEAVKVYTSATARLLGEVRRLALSIREYRSHVPKKSKLRLAQVG